MNNQGATPIEYALVIGFVIAGIMLARWALL